MIVIFVEFINQLIDYPINRASFRMYGGHLSEYFQYDALLFSYRTSQRTKNPTETSKDSDQSVHPPTGSIYISGSKTLRKHAYSNILKILQPQKRMFFY